MMIRAAIILSIIVGIFVANSGEYLLLKRVKVFVANSGEYLLLKRVEVFVANSGEYLLLKIVEAGGSYETSKFFRLVTFLLLLHFGSGVHFPTCSIPISYADADIFHRLLAPLQDIYNIILKKFTRCSIISQLFYEFK